MLRGREVYMFRWRTAGELVCAAAAHADSFACKSSATSSLSLSLSLGVHIRRVNLLLDFPIYGLAFPKELSPRALAAGDPMDSIMCRRRNRAGPPAATQARTTKV
jgi:hypothetical protein